MLEQSTKKPDVEEKRNAMLKSLAKSLKIKVENRKSKSLLVTPSKPDSSTPKVDNSSALQINTDRLSRPESSTPKVDNSSALQIYSDRLENMAMLESPSTILKDSEPNEV